MGDQGADPAEALVERWLREFRAGTVATLLDHINERPDQVRAFLAGAGEQLAALATLVGGADGSASAAALAGQNGSQPGVEAHGAMSASGAATHAVARAAGLSGRAAYGIEQLGRNQRSRVREMLALEALAKAGGACTADELMVAVKDGGLVDTRDALNAQLHRIKKDGLVTQPDTGLYAITDKGRADATALRRIFGKFLED